MRESFNRAQEHNRSQVTPMDLLLSLLTASNSIVAECFERIGVTAAKLTEQAAIAEHSGRDNEHGERATKLRPAPFVTPGAGRFVFPSLPPPTGLLSIPGRHVSGRDRSRVLGLPAAHLSNGNLPCDVPGCLSRPPALWRPGYCMRCSERPRGSVPPRPRPRTGRGRRS